MVSVEASDENEEYIAGHRRNGDFSYKAIKLILIIKRAKNLSELCSTVCF